MSALTHRLRSRHIVDLAFLATVAAAVASAAFERPALLALPGGLPFIGLALAYTLMGVLGYAVAGRARSLAAGLAYLAVQIALASAILYASRSAGFISIAVLPLVSHSLWLLPRPWAAAACGALVLAVGAVAAALGGLAIALQAAIATLAGVIFVAVFTDIALREQKARAEVERLAAELTQANDTLRQYAAKIEELATAKERNRLAREIHDSLGHYLTVINVQLEAARALIENRPGAAEAAIGALSKAQTLAQEGLADVRRSVAALRAGPTDERPLPEAVRALVDEWRAGGVEAALAVMGQPRRLPPQVELTIYRAAQEGLTNVRKHADASRAEVALDYSQPERVRLAVQDNGRAGRLAAGGFGLLGLRERALLLGGEVRAGASGQGFVLEVVLPG
jgi:signal transduction histidine kinase